MGQQKVIGIVEENKIPVKFIGVGEQIDDMEIFNSEDFVKAIIQLTDGEQGTIVTFLLK